MERDDESASSRDRSWTDTAFRRKRDFRDDQHRGAFLRVQLLKDIQEATPLRKAPFEDQPSRRSGFYAR